MRPILLALCAVLGGVSAIGIHGGLDDGLPGRRPLGMPQAIDAVVARGPDDGPLGSFPAGSRPRLRANRSARTVLAFAAPPAGGTDVALEAIGDERGAGLQRAEGEAAEARPLSLWRAAFHGSETAVRDFIEGGADPNRRNRNGTTPLYVAAQNGHLAVVELLLAAGAEVNAESKSGATPLLVAAHNSHVDVLRLLLDGGAFPNSRTKQTGQTALWQASYLGHLEVVQILLGVGADANLPEVSKGATPLYAAASRDHAQVVLTLVDTGASINAPLDNGATPLHAACALLRPRMVEILLQNGADASALDAGGRTPADVVGVAVPARDGALVAEVLRLLESTEAPVTPGGEGPSAIQNAVAAAGNGTGSKRLSVVVVLVPVLAGVIVIVALMSTLRFHRWSRSRAAQGRELDRRVKMTEVLTTGFSDKAMPLGFDPKYDSSSPDSCRAAGGGRWGDSPDARDAEPILAPVRPAVPGAGPGASCGLWSRGGPSLLSSPTHSSDDDKALWSAFMAHTRGGGVVGTTCRL